MTKNSPIAYDFHGDIPFTIPFEKIKPEEIHIYLDIDTKTGKNTCGQNCSHCWFVNYEKVSNRSFSIEEGLAIKKAVENEGYKVFARYVDSFSYGGDFMKIHGPAHNREFRQENDHKPTKTMKKGDAWTSGRPLLADNWVELLDIARVSGYGTISITFHGLLDEHFKLKDKLFYPIKGVFSGADTEKVVARIFEYNRLLEKRGLDPKDAFRINIGITLGRHNHTKEMLSRYAHYFNSLGVDTVRFNNFLDHGGRHPVLQLEEAEIEQAYRDIKWLHENLRLYFQLAVSEDFGTYGVGIMNFPEHVGWCRAGRQLFTVIPVKEEVIDHALAIEKIGEIVACVNIFQPLLGTLTRIRNSNGTAVYSLHFNHEAIHEFTQKRMAGVYKNGCFARELLHESPLELTKQAKAILTSESKKFEPAFMEAK